MHHLKKKSLKLDNHKEQFQVSLSSVFVQRMFSERKEGEPWSRLDRGLKEKQAIKSS